MNLRERAGLVDTVGSALTRGEHTLTVLPDLIRQLLEEGAWREFETKLGKHVTYDRFEDFVTTPPLSGLGTSIGLVRRIVADDLVTLDLLDQTMGNHQGERTDLQSNFGLNQSEVAEKKRDRSGQIIRRLRKDFPELHEQVLRKEKTVHAAAVEAGIYPVRLTVNLDNPKSAATLISKASPAFLEELRRLLQSEEQTMGTSQVREGKDRS